MRTAWKSSGFPFKEPPFPHPSMAGREKNQRQLPLRSWQALQGSLAGLNPLVTALDVLHVSLAPAAVLFFVWEIKLLVGKVSGLATCHQELDESVGLGASGHLSPRTGSWAGVQCHCQALSDEPSVLGRKESRLGISEAPVCSLCDLKATVLTHCAILGCSLPNPPLVLPLLCPVSQAAVSLFSQASASAGFSPVWPWRGTDKGWEVGDREKWGDSPQSVCASTGIP